MVDLWLRPNWIDQCNWHRILVVLLMKHHPKRQTIREREMKIFLFLLVLTRRYVGNTFPYIKLKIMHHLNGRKDVLMRINELTSDMFSQCFCRWPFRTVILHHCCITKENELIDAWSLSVGFTWCCNNVELMKRVLHESLDEIRRNVRWSLVDWYS